VLVGIAAVAVQQCRPALGVVYNHQSPLPVPPGSGNSDRRDKTS
jgi:hypothetical protein